ncbi:MAG TPA: hypothetical protein VLL77_12000 [Anaerolineales bacterium]|nr:hypothetical protein [Anaerolineales bacterium]
MSRDRSEIVSLFSTRLGLAALILTLLIAVGATAIFWQTTRWGVGLGSDSLAYIGGARNLLAGDGYTRTTGAYEKVPITHFPPFYSVSLAAVGRLLNLDPLQAARPWHAALLLAGTLLAALAFALMAQRPWMAPLGAVLFAADAVFFETFAWGLSEALYLVLLLASLLAIAAYMRRRARPTLILAAALIALIYLTRYAGLALILTGLLVLLVIYTGRRSDRIDVVIFLAITLAPVALLTLTNTLAAGSAVNRGFTWHLPEIGELRLAVRGVWEWLLPAKFLAGKDPELPPYVRAFVVLLLSILALAGALLVRARRAARRDSPLTFLHGLSLLAALHIVIYAVLLLANWILVDASTPVSNRILSPIYLSLLLLIGCGFALLVQSHTRPLQWLALPLALLLVFIAVDDTIDVARRIHAGGLGYASSNWKASPTIQAITELPPDPILTDQPDAVYLLTGRPAFIVFGRINPVTGLPRPDYDEWLASMRHTMCDEDGWLVIFVPDLLQFNPADREMIETVTEGMRLDQKYEDGAIYRCDGA